MQLKSDDLRTWYLEMDQHLYSTHIILPQGAKVVELTQNIPEPSVATRGWPSGVVSTCGDLSCWGQLWNGGSLSRRL